MNCVQYIHYVEVQRSINVTNMNLAELMKINGLGNMNKRKSTYVEIMQNIEKGKLS